MIPLRQFLRDLALVALSILAAAILIAVVLAIAGYPAHRILAQWILGAVGTRADLLASLKGACPLMLTGLAAGVAFRSGVFNIGAEGQSILGAIAAVTLATRLWPAVPSSWIGIPLILLAAAAGGALWAFFPAALDRFRGVPIVLSTILLNFIALNLLDLLLEGPLGTHSTQIVQSDTLPDAYLFPLFFYHAGGYIHLGFFIALAIAGISWLVQSRTAFGFELRVTGLNPIAAQYAGMPVARRQFAVMLYSGALAGLAGAMQLMGVEGAAFLNPEPKSYGYAGIAVALLGRLHPAGIVAAAIFFAMLDRGATNLELYHFPLQFSDIAKGLIVLVILSSTAFVARGTRET